MQIYFEGKNKKISEEEYSQMLVFFADLMMNNKQQNKLSLLVSFKKKHKMEGVDGYMLHLSKNQYMIWINKKIYPYAQRETFAHELVHVKQYLNKEVSKKDNKIKSKGLKSLQTTSSDYWDNPMEIEAFGRSVGLTYRWHLKHCNE
jgi:Zn-dependent peptidase ImmA (M78 family)